MPFILRKTQDESNPRLPDAWGVQQTAGRLVYWYFDGSRTYFLILFGRGGKYGWDGLNFFNYKGAPIPELDNTHDESTRNWRFHPGTVTKQIALKNFTANASTDVLTANAHGYANGDSVRVRSVGGVVPAGLSANQLYYVINSTTNTFKISETSGGSSVDLTDAGTGTLKVWKANAGFDDPVQGRPQFFPELNLTFSNITYIEGMIPAIYSADEEPKEFEFGVRCRKVGDYDNTGAYLGNSFSANNARVQADILLNELKRPATRQNWGSWFAFKQACDVMIWDRGVPDAVSPGTGLTGRLYNGTNFDTLVVTRIDNEINFSGMSSPPAVGVSANYFSARWEGKIKARHTDTYNFPVAHDDGVRVWIDNQLIIDQWTTAGTHTGSIALTADALVNVKIEFENNLAPWGLIFKWQSASQGLEVVPQSRLYPSDSQVKRYEAHVVFDGATQCAAAIEELMKRAPGWHIQDVGGQFKFLPPDRAVVHTFLYDPDAVDERWNIAAKTFEAKPRKSDERPNFRNHYYNDLNAELLGEKYVEGDRPELREQQGGLPTDISPARWGVMTRSLCKRIAENEMRLFSDPDRDFGLSGQTDSYHVSKGDRVLLAHVATGETLDTAIECLVASENFGTGSGDEKSYALMVVKFPLIEDEPV